jgi:hypothetical protein
MKKTTRGVGGGGVGAGGCQVIEAIEANKRGCITEGNALSKDIGHADCCPSACKRNQDDEYSND